jgi:mono/diheme cytochrome c family protein
MLKTVLKIVGGLVLLIVVAIGGAFMWGSSKSAAKLAEHYDTHKVDFPIPFPLSDAEITELGDAKPAEPELAKLALDRAIVRGKHLVDSRYACIECHGKDFGGGVMVDAPPIGQLFGVNITSGKGGQVANYKAGDWDRIVRHGVKPDGTPAAMPSIDFAAMTDRELSDVVSYIRSAPPVDKEIARPVLGPVGKMLIATGKLPLSAHEIKDHQAPHRVEPPVAAVNADFGKHLVGVCAGCHNPQLNGGPVPGGDPAWPPARNLTPHADGLAGWKYEDFTRALKEGKRRDGTDLRAPMSAMKAYAANCTDTELQAMWAYLQTVPALPSPK